ncbi:hypothetical protein N7540_002338 [Penicillium herquei]|nr:hypothetical protein N7540_002338 [Penicillium herquei]
MAKVLGRFALSAGMVHLNVGPSGTPFDVHVELLCSYSPYFDSIYSNRTVEPIPSDPISFPEDDPDVFAELLAWMYHGDNSIDIPSRSDVFFLLKLWILAAKFEVSKLQNHVMQLCKIGFDKKPDRILDEEKIQYVYTNTWPQSPLRLFLVDHWARNASHAYFQSRQETLPRSFLEEFCSAFFERKEKTNSAEGEIDFAERYNVKSSRPKDDHENLFSQARENPEPV